MEDRRRHWKLVPPDLVERTLWDDHMRACSDMITWTSTDVAPWCVIPADDKRAARLIVASVVLATLAELDPQYQEPMPEPLTLVEQTRDVLAAEVAGTAG